MSVPPPLPIQPPARRGLSRPVRWLLMALAVLSLVLGLVGVFVPVLPTVPFVLLAAWAAARSSPRLSHWLEHHPRLGPPIRAWRQGGVVRRPAKWAATVMMAMSATTLLLLVRPLWMPVAVVAVMATVGLWLWRRPEQLPQAPSA